VSSQRRSRSEQYVVCVGVHARDAHENVCTRVSENVREHKRMLDCRAGGVKDGPLRVSPLQSLYSRYEPSASYVCETPAAPPNHSEREVNQHVVPVGSFPSLTDSSIARLPRWLMESATSACPYLLHKHA
jgi:hypothetical protein